MILIEPQEEPLPEKDGLSPWINEEMPHPDQFKEDTEFLKKYNLPPIDKKDLEKN